MKERVMVGKLVNNWNTGFGACLGVYGYDRMGLTRYIGATMTPAVIPT